MHAEVVKRWRYPGGEPSTTMWSAGVSTLIIHIILSESAKLLQSTLSRSMRMQNVSSSGRVLHADVVITAHRREFAERTGIHTLPVSCFQERASPHEPDSTSCRRGVADTTTSTAPDSLLVCHSCEQAAAPAPAGSRRARMARRLADAGTLMPPPPSGPEVEQPDTTVRAARLGGGEKTALSSAG